MFQSHKSDTLLLFQLVATGIRTSQVLLSQSFQLRVTRGPTPSFVQIARYRGLSTTVDDKLFPRRRVFVAGFSSDTQTATTSARHEDERLLPSNNFSSVRIDHFDNFPSSQSELLGSIPGDVTARLRCALLNIDEAQRDIRTTCTNTCTSSPRIPDSLRVQLMVHAEQQRVVVGPADLVAVLTTREKLDAMRHPLP